MIAALVEYGLFLAKSLTLVLLVGVLLTALLRTRGGFHGDGERIEVSDLNGKYREMARVLKQASLPKKAAAKALKEDRKAHKQYAKAGKGDRRRLFVIDFHGDIKATEVASLRELITCVLMEAGEGDELLVRLENAGGTLSEHGLAASQLARVRRSKVRLTVAVDKVAASGGYLMACVADRIIVAPFAAVGSIGVVVQLPNFHRLLERRGVDFELHTAGEYKRTLTLFGENSDADREKVREQLEDTHGLFKDFIREYRPDVDLGQVATGEYWHGTQAVQLGLVDAVETSDDYLLNASADAAIYLVAYVAHKRPLERLLSAMHSGVLRVLSGRW
ncbi:MAG: Possible protease sohB (EC 3.4.21.-) [Olavius algarvensis Gamma 1 endosymbiont]|nr:MAG: Possible protease sohB (EC 3.4.21.-) [Olavius algarvensis Gamma 1 endosymbiont]